ncbi:NAD(P)-dependent oxidoreductase [Arthrobacter livingstonensis]|uniref:NAD(P)-dependent oxidoreductase n=1 Tax=Arthrobacter livingstonensis TaxID=670078 RepID=A0A2V5L2B7_9MICC|nr:SDR family oxidoreductase [Arthrobacter livingstonensis]PYI65208.1 NAD(P)-dependent oxidoreductase [Arthrobacter livingstonensis]
MIVEGRIALITGASSGIGLALARLLAAKGATTALAARSAGKLEQLASELAGSLAIPTDMRDGDAVRRMVEVTYKHCGRIDILVNNAGRAMHTAIAQADLQEYRYLFNLNVVGPLQAMQLVAPLMKKHGGGVIVNVSSGTTLRTLPGVGPYSSSKHALNNLSKVARMELAADNISVALVYPYVTATNFGGGANAPGPARPGVVPDTAEYAASLVLEAIETEHEGTYAAKTAAWLTPKS